MDEQDSVKVRIERTIDSPLCGTNVFIGGVQVPQLLNVELKHRAGSLSTLNLELLADSRFDFELPSQVKVKFAVREGYRLIANVIDDNTIQYTCERIND